MHRPLAYRAGGATFGAGKRIIEGSGGHPVDHKLLHVGGATGRVKSRTGSQLVMPAWNFQPVRPTVLDQQKPLLVVLASCETNCAEHWSSVRHFCTSCSAG